MALAVIIGELVPRFDIVMGLIGGSLTGPLIFILPPLFYSKILKLENIHDFEVARQKQLQHIIDDDSENEDIINMGYGTFINKTVSKPDSGCNLKSCCRIIMKYFRLLYSDCVLSFSVIIFGLAATFASTYFNIANVTSFSQFWSPCIFNTSYSILNL